MLLNLRYEAAMAAVLSFKHYTAFDFGQMGVLPEDYQLVSRAVIWRADQRLSVVRTLEAVLFGTSSVLGLGRVELPAEFIAMAIACSVHPCNMQLACFYLANANMIGRSASDIASGAETEPVTAKQLFALVFLLCQEEATTRERAAFAERMENAFKLGNSAVVK